MKTIKAFGIMVCVTILALFTPVSAQQPVAGVTLQTVTGNSPTLIASVAGTAGTTTAYYVLIAKFTGGSIPSNIVTVSNAPSTLDSTNFVSFVWLPVAGVTGYDLLKLTSASLPTTTATVALHASLSATTTASVDQGTSLSSYTLAAAPTGATATITLNSRDYKSPQVEFSGPSSMGLANNGKAALTTNVHRVKTDATATGVTLAAAAIVNGVYLHAPTGAVNDTTDTAANIVAALPNCYIGAANGSASGFTFSLINNSAGANTITVLAGDHVTLASSVSPLTVAQNTVQNFVGIVTACTGTPAVTLYSIGNAAVY